MKLKRFISAFLSAAVFIASLMCATVTVSAASVKLDSELSLAAELGFLTKAQQSRLGKNASLKEVAAMVTAAVKKYYGKTGKFLPDRAKAITKDEDATRYFFAATLFYGTAAVRTTAKYTDYYTYMDETNWSDMEYVYQLMPDGAVVGKAADGTIQDLSSGVLVDIDDIAYWTNQNYIDYWKNPDSGIEYRMYIDYGRQDPVDYVIYMYDHVSGLPVMTLDKNYAFRPAGKITVEEVARGLVRWYRAQTPKPKYVSLTKAGTYDKTLIPDELPSKESSLPEASNKHLPEWRGIMVGNKGYAGWRVGLAGDDRVTREGEIKAIADTGFNAISLIVNLTWIQGYGYNPGKVNLERLKEIDQIIGWAIKYDLHVTLTGSAVPGLDPDNEFAANEMISDPKINKEFTAVWKMFAKRYKGIDNKYLGFNLMVEPDARSDEDYGKLFGPAVKAVFSEDKDRVVIADIHTANATGESIAKLGACLSAHHYEPREFCNITGDKADDPKWLKTVSWPYTTEDGTVLDAEKSLEMPKNEFFDMSVLTIQKTAEKYGVGFMVGEFGYFTGDVTHIPTHRYSDEVLKRFYEDMTNAFAKHHIGWIVCSELLIGFRPYDTANYIKLENSVYWYDENLGAIFKKINGVPNLSAPKSVKAAKASAGKAKISWNKVSGADGYEICWSSAKDGEYKVAKTVKKGSTVNTTFSGKKGTTYYFKVRAYKTVNGRKYYSDYSAAKKVKL